MHLANQSSRKPDKLSQGSSKLDKLSQSSMGGHPRYKGNHRPPGLTTSEGSNQGINKSSESREAEQRRTLGQGTTQTVDYPCCRKLWFRHKV